MKTVLLAGGQGKRLWPEIPKQFLNIFNNSENMLKRTYKLVQKNNKINDIYIATSKKYENEISEEICKNNIIVEPEMRGTYAAILNVAMYLKYKVFLNDEEIITIIPIDHDVDHNFYNILEDAEKLLKRNNNDLCLIGIKPKFLSTEYGYVISKNNKVIKFIENQI